MDLMIRIDSNVTTIADHLRDVPKDLRRELRPKLRLAASLLVTDMRNRYAVWSTRIPGGVKSRVSFAGRGVQVYVDRRVAPHARPLEGKRLRHPVFGTDTWVEQPTRPTFTPAVRANESKIADQVQQAINAALGRS